MQALHKLLLLHVLTYLGQNALGAKIMNGVKVPEDTMLFMASVQTTDRHVCGGSLISDNFVLTTAHCDDDDDHPLVRVVLGTHDLRKNGTVRTIEQRCRHPDYQPDTIENDIMLLKLSQSVPVGGTIRRIRLPPPDMNLQPNQLCNVTVWGLSQSVPVGGAIRRIPLPPPGMNLQPAQLCHVAGWGVAEDSDQRTVDDLRVVNVSVVDQDVCTRQWSKIPANVICAGGYKTHNRICHGDAGGPLVCNGMAAGIVSYGYEDCNDPDFPDVYTDVSKFRPWIDQILKENGC